MKRVRFQWLLLAFGFVMLSTAVACQSVSKENFGLLTWEENCRLVHEKCCKGKTPSQSASALYGANMTECLANYSKEIDLGLIKINYKNFFDALAKNENVSFDSAKAGRCLDLVRGLTCDGNNTSLSLSGQCEGIYYGTTQEGQSCGGEGVTLTCAAGLTCYSTGSGGTCQKRAQDGESCESRSCDDSKGLICDFTDKKCKMGKKAGEACQNFGDCAPDLTCTEQKCAARPATPLCN